MFAGHVGAALAIARVERRVNVGWLVSAALLLDLILWVLVLLGVESVSIPASFGRDHQPLFEFPYSHGLVAALLWSLLTAALALIVWARFPLLRTRIAVLSAVAVFSHWLLDALVHRPELPLAGPASPAVGLGLDEHPALAITLEALILGAGLVLFGRGSALGRGRLLALSGLSVALLALTVVGMTVAPPPPSALAMAASSLGTLILACALYGWLGRNAAPSAWDH
ncbi:MAG TPA: hypothetical protein VEY89_13775 [Candidatus Dormibacteraeota bacterium]|nr:hypothetical protein [Candidatus Dormibacteraeota bacterium]